MRHRFLFAFMISGLTIVSAQAPSKQAKQAPDPRSLVLVSDRLKPLKYDEMAPEQHARINQRGARWSR